MSDENRIISQVRERQRRLGRIMQKNGVTLKAVSIDSGLCYPTLLSYFTQKTGVEPAVMPITALIKLFGVIPDEWLSILTEPEGRCFHGTTQAEKDAEAAIRTIRDSCDRALADMRGEA